MKRETLDALIAARAAGRSVVLLTELATGAQRILDPAMPADVPGPVVDAARDALERSRSVRLALDGRDIFLRAFAPAVRLVIVGAVHIAQPLCAMALLHGFDVTVVDPRRGFASEARFPDVALDLRWPDVALSELALDARTALVTLTHDPRLDEPALRAALRSPAFYVGALGSKRTHAARLARLADAGVPEADLARIRGPVGLDIGARSAAEIATSIMAQLIAQLRKAPA